MVRGKKVILMNNAHHDEIKKREYIIASDKGLWTDSADLATHPLDSETCCVTGATAGELTGRADKEPAVAVAVAAVAAAAAAAAAARRDEEETDPVSVTALPSSIMESRFFRLLENAPVNRTSSRACSVPNAKKRKKCKSVPWKKAKCQNSAGDATAQKYVQIESIAQRKTYPFIGRIRLIFGIIPSQ